MNSKYNKQVFYNKDYFYQNKEKSLLLWEFLQNANNIVTTNPEELKYILTDILHINGHLRKDKIMSLGKYIEEIGNAEKIQFVANFEFCFGIAIRYAVLL